MKKNKKSDDGKRKGVNNIGVDKMRKSAVLVVLVLFFLVATACIIPVLADGPTDDPEDPVRFQGTITGSNEGYPVVGAVVTIEKDMGGTWIFVRDATTNDSGYYETTWIYWTEGLWPSWWLGDDFRMKIDGKIVDERHIYLWDFKEEYHWHFSYTWDQQIPEFATIAIPAAMTLGLVFFMRRRKRED